MFKSFFQIVKNLIRGYRYTKNEHCNDPKLLALLADFRDLNFDKVEETLLSFSSDYRDFGFSSLGAVDDTTIIEKWIEQSSNSDAAQIVLALHKAHLGWKSRGVGFAKSVKEEDMKIFRSLIEEAKDILFEIKSGSSEFDINKDVALLALFKAINLEDRAIIHETFKHGLEIDPANIGLHINYFTAISEKWGGTREELNTFFEYIPNEPALLGQCIQATYYWDLVKVYEVDDEQTEQKIRAYVKKIDRQGIPKDNLYRYDLYLSLYWLSAMLVEGLESKYYNLVKPYWDDKI